MGQLDAKNSYPVEVDRRVPSVLASFEQSARAVSDSAEFALAGRG
jgi:hypothetical protein